MNACPTGTILSLLVVVLAVSPICRAVDADAPAGDKTTLKTWVYEARSSQDPGVAAMKDADALDGEALECPATTKVWSGWYTFVSGYTMDYVPGEYEVRFRVKTEDNTKQDYLLQLGVENGDMWVHLKGVDFKEPGKYQEFVYPFTITNPVLNICVIRRLAGPAVWIDRVTVTQKRVFTETEQLQRTGFKRSASPRLIRHEGTNVWFAKGLYYRHYGLHTAIETSGAKVSYASVVRGQRGSALIGAPLDSAPSKSAKTRPPEVPELDLKSTAQQDTADGLLLDDSLSAADPYDHVMRYNLIVLCDVDAECFSPRQRALIADFVAAGGGLLVVGGPFALGRGQWGQSELLSPLLPVTLTGEYDLQRLVEPIPLRPQKGHISTTGLAWDQQPRVLWAHTTTPKEGSTIELMAGDMPGLVTWCYGKGRVAVLTATVFGEMPAPQIGFWEWSDWPRLMTNLAQWLLGNNSVN